MKVNLGAVHVSGNEGHPLLCRPGVLLRQKRFFSQIQACRSKDLRCQKVGVQPGLATRPLIFKQSSSLRGQNLQGL